MDENRQIIPIHSVLIDDLRSIINHARTNVAVKANEEIILMFWEIGERINREVLGNKRATYGQQIVSQVATQLQAEFGEKGFGVRSIRRMMQFAEYFPDNKIVSQVASQLSWSHIIEILPLKDAIQREFYLTMASTEHWGRDLLRAKIDGMLYERTALRDGYLGSLARHRSTPSSGSACTRASYSRM